MQRLHVLGRGLSLGRAQQGLPVWGQVLLVQALSPAQEGQSAGGVRPPRPQDCQAVVGLHQALSRLTLGVAVELAAHRQLSGWYVCRSDCLAGCGWKVV